LSFTQYKNKNIYFSLNDASEQFEMKKQQQHNFIEYFFKNMSMF